MRDPASGSRKLAVPTATRRLRRPETTSASAPDSIPPMPITGIDTAPATRAPARARRDPGSRAPRGRRRPAPASGSRVPGSSAAASSVLISETASAPPSSAAAATLAGSATFGVSFTISGFGGQGRTASSSASVSSRLLADDQARLHVRTRDVQLQRRDLVRDPQRPRRAAGTLRGSSPSPRRSAGPAARRAPGRSCSEEALESLVREADRVDHPRRRLEDPRRGVARLEARA